LQEELDLSCTFVCKAREKAGVRLPPLGRDRSPGTGNMEPGRRVPEKRSGDPGEGAVPPQPLQPKAPSPSTVQQSLVLAGHGISAAEVGQHTEAVWAFTAALELNPREHRLLGNRSYCLEKLGRYEEALRDAEAALGLQPGWPKGSFRKGKALRGLQRYAEAVRTFEELLLQDGTYAEAATQLEACRALLQVRPPFPTPHPLSLPCCAPHTSPLSPHSSAAVPGVSPCPLFCSRLRSRCFSLVRDRDGWTVGARGCPRVPSGDCFPLWVGNVTPHINEKVLRRAFGRFGEIHSMRLLPGRHCAFINFSGKAAAEAAYRDMQGATVEGSELLLQLKHPAHATPAPLPRA
ncbi:TTC31 protein, partial [Menura novaehollandiae]|nr:TTC31 protein [Menura novaehollandiae]